MVHVHIHIHIHGGCVQDGNIWKSRIEHWDGSSWSQVPSPNPGAVYNFLRGVSAVSPSDAWAVGWYRSPTADRPLIEHWDGISWTRT